MVPPGEAPDAVDDPAPWPDEVERDRARAEFVHLGHLFTVDGAAAALLLLVPAMGIYQRVRRLIRRR